MVGEEGFGAILKRHRIRLGLKQKELAQAVALSPSYISKLEREDRPPPPHIAKLLANFFRLEGEEKLSFLEAARRVRIRHLESKGLKKAPARLQARVPPLPQRIRSPIGRDKEIEDIIDQLTEPEVIINITGDPAIGKTTVALEVAHRYRDQERLVLWGDAREGTAEGVAQVEALIWNSIVGGPVPDSEVQKKKRLSAAVGEYKPLIVLDNLESAKEFTEILDFARQIGEATSVLITSRRWIPAGIGDNVSLFELSEHEGIRLFEKVGEAYGRRPVTEKDHLAIEVICKDFLAGHPGAIEIAASLWKGWPLEAILRGLKQRAMETLEDPHRTDINRSMRLSIGLSYDLLHEENPEAWELFPRLSVFQASFSHRAVEAVAGITEILPALEFLVDRSLVRFDGRRHSLHAVVREFGLEKLGEARGEHELRAAQYFLDFAQEHESDFDRLDEEKGNLFATMDWAEAHEEHRGIALELASELMRFMDNRGLWAENLRRMQRALEIAELVGDKHEIMFRRFYLGISYRFMRDEKHTKKLFEDGLTLAREIDDPRAVGLALLLLADYEFAAQNYLRARELGGQSIQFLEKTGAKSLVCSAFRSIGKCEKALGNFDEAYSYFEKALALARKLEDTSDISSALVELFELDVEVDRLASAEEKAREYEKLAQLTNDPFSKGMALLIWAELMLATSGPEAAKRHVLAAVSHFEKVGSPAETVTARESLVEVAECLNDLPLQEEQLTAIARAFSDFGANKEAASAFYRLGLVQEELNKPRDATRSYERALSLYSSLGMLGDPRAKEMTERLERIRTQVS